MKFNVFLTSIPIIIAYSATNSSILWGVSLIEYTDWYMSIKSLALSPSGEFVISFCFYFNLNALDGNFQILRATNGQLITSKKYTPSTLLYNSNIPTR